MSHVMTLGSPPNPLGDHPPLRMLGDSTREISSRSAQANILRMPTRCSCRLNVTYDLHQDQLLRPVEIKKPWATAVGTRH